MHISVIIGIVLRHACIVVRPLSVNKTCELIIAYLAIANCAFETSVP